MHNDGRKCITITISEAFFVCIVAWEYLRDLLPLLVGFIELFSYQLPWSEIFVEFCPLVWLYTRFVIYSKIFYIRWTYLHQNSHKLCNFSSQYNWLLTPAVNICPKKFFKGVGSNLNVAFKYWMYTLLFDDLAIFEPAWNFTIQFICSLDIFVKFQLSNRKLPKFHSSLISFTVIAYSSLQVRFVVTITLYLRYFKLSLVLR